MNTNPSAKQPNDQAVQQLESLLQRIWDRDFDDQATAELAQLLSEHPALRLRYIETVHAHSNVSAWSFMQQVVVSSPVLRSLAEESLAEERQSAESTGQSPKSLTVPNLAAAASERASSQIWISPAKALAALAATLLLAFAGWQSGWFGVDLPEQVASVTPAQAEEETPSGKLPPFLTSETTVANEVYVAQITDITPGAILADSSQPDFLLRLRRGEPFAIEQGLAEIQYFSGARLILHGPALFIPIDSQSGRLVSGRISGEVSEGDFTLLTPSARVVDLGTAFGVTVDDSDNTGVVVFDGEVQVSAAGDAASLGKALHLTEGMTARVANNGAIQSSSRLKASDFTRSFPQRPTNVQIISLADLLSGVREKSPGESNRSNGYRLAGVIDPTTGKHDLQPWLRSIGPGDRTGDGKYHATNWHPVIDGVFIPAASGEAVQINSGGQRVDLPKNLGATWGPIWSRRKTNSPLVYSKEEDFWGTDTFEGLLNRLTQSQAGILGIHSNVGITFDLEAIRRQYRMPINQLEAIVTNIENSKTRLPANGLTELLSERFSADFRIYVDGKLRYERLDFVGDDGDEPIRLPLQANDRFLTFITTDSNGDNAFDHVVLVDPVLSADSP